MKDSLQTGNICKIALQGKVIPTGIKVELDPKWSKKEPMQDATNFYMCIIFIIINYFIIMNKIK